MLYLENINHEKEQILPELRHVTKKDPNNDGTYVGGNRNEKYCSYCNQQGAFTQPVFTFVEMQAFCKEKMKDMGFPGFLVGLFAKGIPKLERWNT